MLRVALSRPNLDDPALAARWQEMAGACGASAFRSWTWVGCLARERYADPVLAEARDGGELVGMALFNRRRGRLGTALHLHESGDPALDAVFIEHNGVLAVPGRAAAVLTETLRAAGREAGRVVLSGLGDAGLAAARAAGGVVGPLQTRLAPFARFGGADPLQGLSRNARAQLRRSERAYAASGSIAVERAAGVEQALDWLGRLLAWHEATWAARGVASAFATAPVQRFHRALIRRGVPAGDVDVLRVAAGPRTIGYLLNLRGGGRVAAYQSGFDYSSAQGGEGGGGEGGGTQEKPGLTCHAAAMRQAHAEGATEYDFLAGDARYKRTLGNDVRAMHWLGWQRLASLPGLAAVARRAIGR